ADADKSVGRNSHARNACAAIDNLELAEVSRRIATALNGPKPATDIAALKTDFHVASSLCFQISGGFNRAKADEPIVQDAQPRCAGSAINNLETTFPERMQHAS